MSSQPIKIELQLLRWSESSNGGKTVTFGLADDESLDFFKQHTLKKGQVAGQLYAAVLALADGQEELEEPEATDSEPEDVEVPSPTASELYDKEPRYGATGKQRKASAKTWGSYSAARQQAIGLCSNPDFRRYATRWSDEPKTIEMAKTIARSLILEECEISNRSDLDYSPKAVGRLKELVADFEKWKEVNIINVGGGSK